MAQQFDIVLFGATSFVGKILARHMMTLQSHHSNLKWAIAGRSKFKLEELKSSMGSAAKDLPILVADAHDDQAVKYPHLKEGASSW